jgi:predicted small lipoprotein YifL
MNRPTASGWAAIVLGMAVLALGGCGRKGPLDLPPNSSSYGATQPDAEAERAASQPSVFDPSYGANTLPTAGKGPKRPFALDPLLNSN